MEHLYVQLHTTAALSRKCDYSQACKELACILRKLYVRAPKTLQLTIFQDVLSAFRLLPEMDTFQQLSAAETLLQAVEASLPKKRKIAAVSEYKQAAVAQHRRAKHQESESRVGVDYAHLSGDLLLQIFGYLDPQSLAVSSAVCRSWNEAANEDGLWCPHFLSMFNGLDFERKPETSDCMFRSGMIDRSQTQSIPTARGRHGSWRKALAWKLCRLGQVEKLSISNRVMCMGCKTFYWLSEPPEMRVRRRNCEHQRHTARPVPVGKVADLILSGRSESNSSSSSESDSDSDEGLSYSFSRSWAYPKFEQRHLRASASVVRQLCKLQWPEGEDPAASVLQENRANSKRLDCLSSGSHLEFVPALSGPFSKMCLPPLGCFPR